MVTLVNNLHEPVTQFSRSRRFEDEYLKKFKDKFTIAH